MRLVDCGLGEEAYRGRSIIYYCPEPLCGANGDNTVNSGVGSWRIYHGGDEGFEADKDDPWDFATSLVGYTTEDMFSLFDLPRNLSDTCWVSRNSWTPPSVEIVDLVTGEVSSDFRTQVPGLSLREPSFGTAGEVQNTSFAAVYPSSDPSSGEDESSTSVANLVDGSLSTFWHMNANLCQSSAPKRGCFSIDAPSSWDCLEVCWGRHGEFTPADYVVYCNGVQVAQSSDEVALPNDLSWNTVVERAQLPAQLTPGSPGTAAPKVSFTVHVGIRGSALRMTAIRFRWHGSPWAGLLHSYVDLQSISMVQFLLDHGADPNITDHRGLKPLLIAVDNGHTDLIHLLVKAGADVNVQDEFGDTLLSSFTFKGDLAMMRFLVASGADPNGKDSVSGNTPLQIATCNGDLNAIQFLLTEVPDTNIWAVNNSGKTAGQIAANSNNPDLVDLFRRAGALQ